MILVPSQGGMSLRDIVHGIDTRWGPLEYTKTDAYPSHGVIDSSPDITGGMGYEGLGALERFVTGGGVLLGLGSGGALARAITITKRATRVPRRTPPLSP